MGQTVFLAGLMLPSMPEERGLTRVGLREHWDGIIPSQAYQGLNPAQTPSSHE
jgi:hypothetical protein